METPMDSTAAGAAAAAGPPHDQPHDQPAPQPVLSFVGHRRRLPPDAELFEEGSLARDEAARGAARAAAHDEPAHLAQEGALAGDPLMAAFLCHEHECGTCHATLPTPHLLGLHVAEVHDSFFAAQAARRLPVFACLVEACGRRFCGAEERKQHLVDHHRFPRNYSFDRMHLRRKKAQVRQRPQYRKSAAQREGHGAAPAAMDAAGPAPGGSGIEAAHAPQDEDVVHSLSGLSVAAQAPRAVSFGRQAPGLELPRPNRSRAAGEGASKRANTGKEDMQCS